jgi:PRTRC genetic system protein A
VSSHSTRSHGPLLTPVLLKAGDEVPWPAGERLFYVLARDGLYRCRDAEFFRSCVVAKTGPSELAEHQPFFEPRFPRIPRALIEQAVGFFARIAELHGSEAAAFLVWDRGEARVRLVVPHQVATVSESSTGYRYPIGVHYDPPTDLPDAWVIFGDIHSHVNHAAYASHTDVHDETHSAGLHIVVGRIQSEPPDLHLEAVVDGERFTLAAEQVIAGYQRRRMDVPEHWIERVEVELSRWISSSIGYPPS